MNKYEIILDVCKTNSISRTAAKLNYTQSAVSQLIKSYEKELGLPLFKRTKQGVELLPNTEGIIRSLEIICSEEKKIRQTAADLNSLDSGYIRIGSIQSISYHWLPDILKDFSETYPNINFELYVDGFKPLISNLKNNKLDCIFVSRYSVPDYPFVPLGKDELVLVTPKDHPLSEQVAVSISDVDKQPFILTADRLDFETGKIFELNGIHPKVRYQLNEDYAVIKMVEKGFGIAILPKLLLYNMPFDVCIRTFTEHYSRVLGAAYLPNTQPSPAVLKLLSFAKEWRSKKEASASDTLL